MDVFERLKEVEEDVDKKHWMELSKEDKERYTQLMREVRIQMTQKGFYDPKMMKMLKRVRCSHNPALAECSMNDE